MNKETYDLIEGYMLSSMDDAAHDKEHIYRVLYTALDIAKTEEDVDMDVLITACLLHDVGRKEQFENPKLCHAQVGAEKAKGFLLRNGFDAEFAERVSECIRSHRFRKDAPPKSIEAKILFDSDKVDVAGALGIARTLVYKGQVNEPIYTMNEDGSVCDGSDSDCDISFLQEYKYKLERLYSKFFTFRGKEIAISRQKAAVDFYNALLWEVSSAYDKGRSALESCINQ